MRRPVVFLFIFFAAGIALAYDRKPEPVHFIIAALILIALIIASVYPARMFGLARNKPAMREEVAEPVKRRFWFRLGSLFLLTALLGNICFYLAENHRDPLESKIGEVCLIEGRIVSVQVKEEDSWKMLITAPHGGKRLIQGKGAMRVPEEFVGKWAVVRGVAELPAESRNPGLFDYRLYLKTKGVRVILQSGGDEIRLQEKDRYLLFVLTARLKYGFLHKLRQVMEPEAFGLMNGMLFGDSSFISDDVYESFQKNGTAHILSVSGIHVGIVYLCICRILGNRKTRLFYLLTASTLLFYAALSEFSPSVVRSVVMIFIHMFARISCRRYDFMTCTSASALAMLLINPFCLFNAGFQLSYMAVFCLAAMMPWMERRIRILEEQGKSGLLTEGLRYFAPLLIIQTGMTPITAYLFNYFSTASFFANIPIIAISGVILPLGIFLIPMSFLNGWGPGEVLFGVGAQAAELLIDGMLRLNELFFLPGIGFFNMVSPPVIFLLIFYSFFFFLSSEFFRVMYQRKRTKELAVLLCLILAVSLTASWIHGKDYRDAGLVFVDVGQGDCLHIRTPEGKNILIDGGGSQNYDVGKNTLLPYLLKNGVKRVDLVIATHLHDDHYLGLVQLSENMDIRQFGTYDANRLKEEEILGETGLAQEDILYLTAGERIMIEKDIWIEVLYPEERTDTEYRPLISDEADENKISLLMKVCYRGLTVLMTGDLGEEGEREIMDAYENDPAALRADILKVGHHGSRFSTGDTFLDTVSPKIAVFQVGKNNFGHPHPTVIDKCSEKGIMIYRNDLDGAIIFTEDRDIIFEKEDNTLWQAETMLRKNMHTKGLIRISGAAM